MKISRYGKPVEWKETDFKDITLPKPSKNEIIEKIKYLTSMPHSALVEHCIFLENENNAYKVKEYKNNTIPTLEHNIDVLVDSEEKYKDIIEKLEKWLKEYKVQCKKYDSNSTILIINCILDKLQELKGEDKQ